MRTDIYRVQFLLAEVRTCTCVFVCQLGGRDLDRLSMHQKDASSRQALLQCLLLLLLNVVYVATNPRPLHSSPRSRTKRLYWTDLAQDVALRRARGRGVCVHAMAKRPAEIQAFELLSSEIS